MMKARITWFNNSYIHVKKTLNNQHIYCPWNSYFYSNHENPLIRTRPPGHNSVHTRGACKRMSKQILVRSVFRFPIHEKTQDVWYWLDQTNEHFPNWTYPWSNFVQEDPLSVQNDYMEKCVAQDITCLLCVKRD